MNPQDQPPTGQTPPQNPSGNFAAGAASAGLPPLMPEPLKPLATNSPTQSAVSEQARIREQVIAKLKEAANILVTVSSSPSVDQLAAAIGITLVLNKQGKHATAVFSGEVPSTIEFLQPEKTIEKNTDSLRDFIIALDKSKADKLRYKVEDKFVRIFITPYHTSLSEEDLEFSQGDFNVDVVLALGVQQKEQLDQAITSHGRILHDATVISINNNNAPTDIGVLNWSLPYASSLSEIMVGVSEVLQDDQKLIDGQVATAFLTGIVAETARFSNDKTSPVTMNTAAKLMDAGANQQLVANKLAAPKPQPVPVPPKAPAPAVSKPVVEPKKAELPVKEEPAVIKSPKIAPKPNITPPPKSVKSSDGALQVVHPSESHPAAKTIDDLQKMVEENEGEDNVDKIHIDEQGTLSRLEELREEEERKKHEVSDLAEPEINSPTNSVSSGDSSASAKSDALTLPSVQEVNSDEKPDTSEEGQAASAKTLADLEESIGSPHVKANDVDDARQAVSEIPSSDDNPEPITALNAQPLGDDLRNDGDSSDLPTQVVGPDKGLPPDETASASPPTGPPPPVPPPMMPPSSSDDSTNPL